MQTLTGKQLAAYSASVGARPRAAGLHHRQAGAHFARPAQHRARADLAPHRRRHRRRRHRARRGGQWPHARGAQSRQLQPYQTRVSRQRHHRDARRRRGQRARRLGSGSRRDPARRCAAASVDRAIRSIDFRRSDTGAGRLVVRLCDPRTPINLQQQGSQIIVDFAGADLPKHLARRYDTLDFGTPVTGFDADARRQRHPASCSMRPASSSSWPTSRTTNTWSRCSRSPSRPRRPSTTKKVYTGETLIAELPGHRHARGAAAAGRRQRPEHRRQRHGQRQRDAAPAERALGPGARHRAAHQGPGQAPGRQRDHRRARRGTGLAREGGPRRQEGHAGARAAAYRIPAGQLRQGGRHRHPAQGGAGSGGASAAAQLGALHPRQRLGR